MILWQQYGGRGLLPIWIIVRQGPTVLAVDAGGVIWIFFLLPIFFLTLSGGQLDMDANILSETRAINPPPPPQKNQPT